MTGNEPERLFDPDAAAAALHITPALIATWKHAGKVMPAGLIRGRNRAGLTPLYRLSELRPLAVAYHERKAAAAARLAEEERAAAARLLASDTPAVMPRLVSEDPP